MLTTLSAFQTQIAAVMETLAKTAVLEISKLVEIECKILRSEVTRGQHEIDFLRKRLQLMEKHMSSTATHQELLNTASTALIISIHDVEDCPTTENQRRIKKECELEEFNGSVVALVDGCLAPEKNQVDTESDRQHDCLQHHEGKQTTEVTIKQEPNALELRSSETAEQQTQESRVPLPVTSQLPQDPVKDSAAVAPAITGSTTAQKITRTQAMKSTSSTHLLNRTSAGKGAALQMQSSSKIDYTHCTAPHLLPQPIKTRTTSRFAGEKRFACPLCGKCFKCFSQLEIHKRSHTGEKPYRCGLCGKRYAQKGHLYTHQRTHTGEKPYRCLHCGKGFIQKCSLDMHRRTHTGEKPFVCVKCGKGFTKKFNLNKHLAVHLDSTAGLHMESDLDGR